MKSKIEAWLPQWAKDIIDALFSPGVLWVLSTVSIVLFVASLFAIPWALGHLPADYLTRRDTHVPEAEHPPMRALAIKIGRNLLGLLLFIAGILMLFLPGQGLLTIFVSLFLIDFPRKRRFQRRMITSPPVFRAINRLRRRSGKEPLEHP